MKNRGSITEKELRVTVTHIIQHLPDSISERKVVLSTIHKLLPGASELKEEIAFMVKQIDAHEQHQLNFISRLTGLNPFLSVPRGTDNQSKP